MRQNTDIKFMSKSQTPSPIRRKRIFQSISINNLQMKSQDLKISIFPPIRPTLEQQIAEVIQKISNKIIEKDRVQEQNAQLKKQNQQIPFLLAQHEQNKFLKREKQQLIEQNTCLQLKMLRMKVLIEEIQDQKLKSTFLQIFQQ